MISQLIPGKYSIHIEEQSGAAYVYSVYTDYSIKTWISFGPDVNWNTSAYLITYFTNPCFFICTSQNVLLLIPHCQTYLLQQKTPYKHHSNRLGINIYIIYTYRFTPSHCDISFCPIRHLCEMLSGQTWCMNLWVVAKLCFPVKISFVPQTSSFSTAEYLSGKLCYFSRILILQSYNLSYNLLLLVPYPTH